TPRGRDEAPGIHKASRCQGKMGLTPAGGARTLARTHDKLHSTRERRAGRTKGGGLRAGGAGERGPATAASSVLGVALSLPTTPDQRHAAWVTLARARSPRRRGVTPAPRVTPPRQGGHGTGAPARLASVPSVVQPAYGHTARCRAVC